MSKPVHAIAGVIAFLTILSFWVSSAVAELFLSAAAVTEVKRAIMYALLLLLPAMATTGASGARLARSRSGPRVEAKRRRMRFLVANGLLFMLPSAVFLYLKATRSEFDVFFHAVQVIELAVGAMQLVLLARNFRDGLRLGRHLPAGPAGGHHGLPKAP